MAVAAPIQLVALGIALLCLLLAQGIATLLRPLAYALADAVPIIGGDIRDGWNWIEGKLTSLWDAWLAGMTLLVEDWLDGVGIAFRWITEKYTSAVDILGQGIEQIVGTALPALGDWLIAQLQAAGDAVAGGLAELWASFQAGIDVLAGRVEDFFGQAQAGIDALGRELAELEAGPIDALASQLDRLDNVAVPGIEAGVRELDGLVDGLADKLRGIELELDDVLPFVAALAGAVTITEAVEGVRSAARSSKKLDRICYLDPDELDDVLDLILLLPSLALIVETIRFSADAFDEILGAMAPSLS